MENEFIYGPFTKTDIGPRRGKVFTDAGIMAAAILAILVCILIVVFILWHGMALSSISAKIGKADFVKSVSVDRKRKRIEVISVAGYPYEDIGEEIRKELKRMPEYRLDPAAWPYGRKIEVSGDRIPDEIEQYSTTHKKSVSKDYSGRRRIARK